MQIESAIRGYFDACSAADKPRLLSCFSPDAVHYFPAGSAFGALRGAEAIADCWVRCVREFGSSWTVDNLVVDVPARQAVIEWTHFKPKTGGYLRGDEWYRFDPAGLIIEIRAYYACPTHAGVAVHQIGDFPYAARGYPMAPVAN